MRTSNGPAGVPECFGCSAMSFADLRRRARQPSPLQVRLVTPPLENYARPVLDRARAAAIGFLTWKFNRSNESCKIEAILCHLGLRKLSPPNACRPPDIVQYSTAASSDVILALPQPLLRVRHQALLLAFMSFFFDQDCVTREPLAR